jgi:soluble lytic murein transglycosylase-like protein
MKGKRVTVMVAISMALAVGVTRAQTVAPSDANLDTQRLFRAAGVLYGLDPNLLAAIASVESAGNPDAISPKGAQGLMQLMPATAARFGVVNSFDPVSNTIGAARFINYLRQWRAAHGVATPLTLTELLAAYNAGEGAVEKYGGIPPYPATQEYVRRVLIAYLFASDRDEFAHKLKAATTTASPVRAHSAPPKGEDPIAKLAEIRRHRAVALSRYEAAGLAGDPHDAQ